MPNENDKQDNTFVFIAAVIAALTIFVVKFPRASAVIVVIILIAMFVEDQEHQRNARYVEYGIHASSQACSETQLQFLIKNNHPTMSLQNIGFDVAGYKPGSSDEVLTGSVYTDQIVPPGKAIKPCLPLQYPDGDTRINQSQLQWKSNVSRISFL